MLLNPCYLLVLLYFICLHCRSALSLLYLKQTNAGLLVPCKNFTSTFTAALTTAAAQLVPSLPSLCYPPSDNSSQTLLVNVKAFDFFLTQQIIPGDRMALQTAILNAHKMLCPGNMKSFYWDEITLCCL